VNWDELVARFSATREERLALREMARAREAGLDSAVERVVEEVNPAIRAIAGYRKKLRPAVATTFDFAADLVGRLPPAVPVDDRSWSKDPRVRALFSGVDDLRGVFSRCDDVQGFFRRADSDQLDECYAMLSMERREREVLGSAMHGEIARRDIKQTTVSFADRRVRYPSAAEPELRKDMEHRAFEVLVALVLERVTAILASREAREERRRLEDMRLRLGLVRAASLAPALGQGDGDVQNQTAQSEAGVSLNTLDDYIEQIKAVLADPAQHLEVEMVTMRLDQMNVKLDDNSAAEGNEITFAEAKLGMKLRRTILICRFPRRLLLPAGDWEQRAARLLS
jgi:hypothetical protein